MRRRSFDREPGVAVVTGASGDFGRAIVHKLAEDGWLTVGVARNEERLRALAREVGGEFEVCDILDHEWLYHTAERISERHPAIKALVNNAGVSGRGVDFAAETENEEKYMAMVKLYEWVDRVNNVGSYAVLKAFQSSLRAGRPSSVVNVISAAATSPLTPSAAYSASKAGQRVGMQALTPSIREQGITIHNLLPAFADTEGFPQDETTLPDILRHPPFMTTPEKVANAVAELVATTKPRQRHLPAPVYSSSALANLVAPRHALKFTQWLFRRHRPAA